MPTNLLASVIAWLRAGYPEGLPQDDYIPLLALLSRRLTRSEIEEVIQQATEGSSAPIDKIDIQVLITKITDELPREEDVLRVQARLAQAGWPLSGFDEDEADEIPDESAE